MGGFAQEGGLHVVGEGGVAAVEQHGQQLLHMLVLGRETSAHDVVAAAD